MLTITIHYSDWAGNHPTIALLIGLLFTFPSIEVKKQQLIHLRKDQEIFTSN